MKLTIQLDDEHYDQLLKRAKGDKAQVAAAIREMIETMKDVAPGDRYLLLHGADRQELERILQTSCDTPQRLINFVRNLCTVKIGSVDRSFTSGELERLRMQAAFHGWTAERFLELTSDEAIRYVLDRV